MSQIQAFNQVQSSSGAIKTAPPSSHTVTTAFGDSLSVDSAAQNTLGYDIILNISVVVASATSATIVLGVGSSATPTTDTVVASFSTAAALTFSFVAYLPNNYYVLVNTTGTISVTSITVQAMGV